MLIMSQPLAVDCACARMHADRQFEASFARSRATSFEKPKLSSVCVP